MKYGQVTHAQGLVADLFSEGWLPRAAAARALHISVRRLDQMVKNGEIRYRTIGPGARLYEVP